ncbi:MAG: hypothetical protein AB8B50_07335 [Pirellulaceae bacterium]
MALWQTHSLNDPGVQAPVRLKQIKLRDRCQPKFLLYSRGSTILKFMNRACVLMTSPSLRRRRVFDGAANFSAANFHLESRREGGLDFLHFIRLKYTSCNIVARGPRFHTNADFDHSIEITPLYLC